MSFYIHAYDQNRQIGPMSLSAATSVVRATALAQRNIAVVTDIGTLRQQILWRIKRRFDSIVGPSDPRGDVDPSSR